MQQNIAKKPHIHLSPNASYERALVCGSPERAEFISSFLKNAKAVAKNREYHSFLGQFDGKDVLILSHGVGSAGAAICFQELIDVGAKRIIRLGTAGALYDDFQIGDVVIATAAVRQDGVSKLMVPDGFPAVPDLDLTRSLIANMKTTETRSRAGIILTSDLFYPGVIEDQLRVAQKANVSAVEMECATLFVIGTLRGVATGALVVTDGNPLKWSEGQYDPRPERLKKSMEDCLHSALKTLVS